MITIRDSAQRYFRHLIDQQGADGLGIRMQVLRAGTPSADCQLTFCEAHEREPSDVVVSCEGFDVYIEEASADYLAEAEIDFVEDRTGGQLTITAPHIKGQAPGEDSPLAERVQYILEAEINPAVAAHGGVVKLYDVTDDGTVVLQFGGGCHGCGMVDVTLKDGIEQTLRQRIPEIAGVRDATDHSTGTNPYFAPGQQGSSAVG